MIINIRKSNIFLYRFRARSSLFIERSLNQHFSSSSKANTQQLTNNCLQIKTLKLKSIEAFNPNSEIKCQEQHNFSTLTVLTNKYMETLHNKNIYQQIQSFIQKQKQKNKSLVQWIPFYATAFSNLTNNNQIVNQFNHQKTINLLIGQAQYLLNPLSSFKNQINLRWSVDNSQILTVQQLCALFPQKVPLSLRKSPPQSYIKTIKERIKQLSEMKQPKINNIFIMGPQIKKWDEVIQVIIDSQGSNIHFFENGMFEKQNQIRSNQHYRLTEKDFLNAVQRINQL